MWRAGWLALGAMFLTACGSVPVRKLSDSPATYAMLPNGRDPLNPDRPAPLFVELAEEMGLEQPENLTRVLERKKGRPLNYLSLSGGGQNGAFGAGFLIGWRESGRRPQFDAVGGVSTGALMATHALLGTPEDDAALEELYTTINADDIYESRSLWTLISGTDSLRDTAPLRKMIARFITPEVLERVAAAADEGRFLFVGTTNVDYDQTWVWHMSRIAQDGDLELYRKVLLASASFPVVFPPVEIDGHLFVDGAARSNLVVAGLTGETRPGPPVHGPGNIYLIDNGKLDTPPQALRRALGEVAATTISVMMNQSMQTAMVRIFIGSKVLGYNFHYVGIHPEVDIGNDPLAFDPAQMQAAFDSGRRRAQEEVPWELEPPLSDDVPSWTAQLIQTD